MKGRGDRPTRVGERIREEISLILQNRVKDPGLGGVTVTDVTMTVDLKIARAHYSVLGDPSGVSSAGSCRCGTPPTLPSITTPPTRKANGSTVCCGRRRREPPVRDDLEAICRLFA